VCQKKNAPKLYVVESLPGGMVHSCHGRFSKTCATLSNTILIIMETDPVMIIFPTESENPWENCIKLGLCMVMYAMPISWLRRVVSMDPFTWWTLTGVGGLKRSDINVTSIARPDGVVGGGLSNS